MTESEPRTGPTPDEAGFRAWLALRSPALRRKAVMLCGDWHRADDLVQETLVAMYASWPRVARGSNVDAYANRVLVSRFIDERRRPWRRERSVQSVPETADPRAAGALSEVEGPDGVLAAALAALPSSQRAVLVLRFVDDLAVDEIARVLEVPPGTVKSRLSRGTEALRAELGGTACSRALASSATPSPVPAAPDPVPHRRKDAP